MQKAFELIEKYRMIEAQDKIIVGVSGGADSLCLLFVLQDYRRRTPFSLLVVHVEHGMRGQESLADARFVEELCRREQIECRVVSCPVPEIAAREGLSPEEAGRRARYETFERIRQETGAAKIAVAHSRDDQAETILFQIARGSGLDGACGMRPVRGNIIRPLLSCSRAQIEEYLTARGILWRTDATNAGTAYARNRVRHLVLPLLRQEINAAADVHLAALGEELQGVRGYIQRIAKEKANAAAQCAPGVARIDVEQFLREEEVIRAFCLRECLQRIGCGLKDITREHIAGILELFLGQSGRRLSLPGGWQAARQFGQVVIWKDRAQEGAEETAREEAPGPEAKGGARAGVPQGRAVQASAPGECEFEGNLFRLRVFPYKNQNILQKTYTKWFDYDKIKDNISVRARQPGDYLVIDRQGRRKKLKQYLIEEKIPESERGRVPLLACGQEILWVVGHRISEAYKVTETTETVLEVQRIGGYDGGKSIGNVFGGDGKQED